MLDNNEVQFMKIAFKFLLELNLALMNVFNTGSQILQKAKVSNK